MGVGIQGEEIMTINKNGEERKKRANDPNNHKWTEEEAIIAFFCYKAQINPELKMKLAKKIDVNLNSFNTRINEFQIFSKGETKRVTEMTKNIFKEYNDRRKDECDRKILLYLGEAFSEPSTIETVTNFTKTAKLISFNELVKNSPQIKLIETKEIIRKILSSGIVDLNGSFLNQDTLVILKEEKDLDFIESGMEGCYFIFSNLPKESVPVLSINGYECYEKTIQKEGLEFGCLYNGKGKSVKERLKVHLFNSNTLEKVKKGNAKTISGTGAMSLISLAQEDFDQLEKEKKYDPSKHKLKPVEKSIQPETIDKREGHAFFLNGIDITESQWKDHKFAVIVLKSDSEFGKILIEEAFCEKNGRPPLCRRHG